MLVTYLMAGYPDPATAIETSSAALEAGSDMLEIGVPFSDPVADGPVIAAAGHAAVAAGAGMETAIQAVRALRERGHDQPILAMGYLNPIVARGPERTLRELREAGVDALIVPDLPAGEDRHLERLVADAGLGICFLVTPNSSPARLEAAVRGSTAFLYVVPLYGVTGARERVAETTVPLLERIRDHRRRAPAGGGRLRRLEPAARPRARAGRRRHHRRVGDRRCAQRRRFTSRQDLRCGAGRCDRSRGLIPAGRA